MTSSNTPINVTMSSTATEKIAFNTTAVSPSAAFVTATGILDDPDSSTEVINDNDPRVTYTGEWVQELNANVSLHDALQAGASLTVDFFGSAIYVLGVAREGQASIVAQYTIDDDISFSESRQVSGSTMNIFDQQYYSILGLPLAQHNLTINVTDFVQNNTRSYTIDCFVVEKSGFAVSTPSHGHSLGKRAIGAIVGSILGAIALWILIFIFVVRCRRAKARRGPDTIPRPLFVRVEKPPQPDGESIASHDGISTPEPRNYMEPWTRCLGFEFRRACDV